MTYVITQGCCNDASCTAVCPVNCIHPTPDEPDFATAEMLYIDPDSCIDCGACMDACPIDVIHPDSLLPAGMDVYREINAEYYSSRGSSVPLPFPTVSASAILREPTRTGELLRVAVVGTGPAAHYATQELLRRGGGRVEVSMLDRLPMPGGLLRYGVAPDHQGTKSIDRMFSRIAGRREVSMFLDVEVGQHISHAELLDHHHAVIYASGTAGDRRLSIPGVELPGSHTAREFVAWYNSHPDATHRQFDLSSRRAVVVGNGNVALDVARILLLDPETLDRTDIADHALAELRNSSIEEVVILGRRAPDGLAGTVGELLAVADLDGVDLIVEGVDGAEHSSREATGVKLRLLAELAGNNPTVGRKRLILRFNTSPTQIHGTDRVSGIDVVTGSETDHLEAGLVLSAIGYKGLPVADLPFDETTGTVPHVRGRVSGLTHTYVTGWIKRGPSGSIGSNRVCAAETVAALFDDVGDAADPISGSAETFARLIEQRRPGYVDKAGWAAIDRHERLLGRARGRPRVKLTDLGDTHAHADDPRQNPQGKRNPS